MRLTGLKILLISPEPWEHIFVSKHHYAIHLAARNNQIFFLGPPTRAESLTETGYRNILQVSYRGFPKGLRLYPKLFQRYFIRQKFEKLEKLCRVQFDVLWSFDNSVFFDFSVLPKAVLSISHIVDFNQDFKFETAARSANICLGVTDSIVSKQMKYNRRSFFINHGYPLKSHDSYFELPKSNFSVRVGYAGNLNLKYIDWKSILTVITHHPHVGFFFAGPFTLSNKAVKRLRRNANVILLGEISSDRISSFYKQMDLLLLCYRANEYKHQLENPHKMMEYLGSGKMIVATFTAQYEQLMEKNIVLMSNLNEEFSEKFHQAVNNLGSWNSDGKRQLRNQIALDNTYDTQIDRIEEILENEFQKRSY